MPQKTLREPKDGQPPEEGRGQRQRRKKREGEGTAGQASGQLEQTGVTRSKGLWPPQATVLAALEAFASGLDRLQAPQKTTREPKDGQPPKEGRGQRQRRKKREGEGTAGQASGQAPEQTGVTRSKGPGRPQAANKGGASLGRDEDGAGQDRVAKKMRPMSSDAGAHCSLACTHGRAANASTETCIGLSFCMV